MESQNNLDQRVGRLETKFAEVATTLTGVMHILDEVKTSLANSRPSMWMLIPGALAFISMLIAGVIAVTSIKGDVSALYATNIVRTEQVAQLQKQIDLLEARDRENLTKERDFFKSRYFDDRGH